jgi:hypothetical protein
MRRTGLLAAAAALLTVASAHVQAAAPAPSALAQDVARLLLPKDTWAAGVQQISAGVQRNLEGHPGSKLQYPGDLPSKIRAEVEAALPYEELVGLHAKELAASYTNPELKELLAFFKAPTGNKWLKVQPKASETVALETQRRVDQKLPAIMMKLGQLAEPPASAKKPSDAPKK